MKRGERRVFILQERLRVVRTWHSVRPLLLEVNNTESTPVEGASHDNDKVRFLSDHAVDFARFERNILRVVAHVTWAAARGLVPDTGYAVIGVADATELLTMALRRVLFLFAVFGVARAARRTLDNQLAVVADREETIEVQSAELRTSQQHFLTLAQGVPVGILETDFDSRAEFVNRAWCELASVPEEKSLGRGWMDSVEPDDLLPLLQVMSSPPEAHESSHPQELSDHIFRIRRPDGDMRWVTGRVAPLLAESVRPHDFGKNAEVRGMGLDRNHPPLPSH